MKYSSRPPSVMRWPSRFAPSLTCVPVCARAMASSSSARHSSWASGAYQAGVSGDRPVSVTPRLTLPSAGSDVHSSDGEGAASSEGTTVPVSSGPVTSFCAPVKVQPVIATAAMMRMMTA